jgi:O-antigen ligase
VLAAIAGSLVLVPHRLAAPIETLLVLAAAVVFVRVLGARVGLLALLIAACMINRYTYSFGSFDIRSEQVAALLGLGLIVYQIAKGRSSMSVLRPSLTEALLGLWFVISFVSSVTAAPDHSRSLKGVALLVISSLGLLLPRRMIDKTKAREQMDIIVKILLLAIAVAGAYGTTAWLAHVFGSMISISPNTVTGHLGAYGTLWEPNVFGAFCAAGAIAWTWLGPRYFRFTWIGIAACLAGTLVSYTRAAWAVVIVVLAISLLGKVRQRANLRQVAFGLIAAAVIALAALGAERATSYYVPVPGQPPSQTTNQGIFALLLNSIDVLGRLDQVKIGGSEIRSHLILGNGTASFGVRHLNQGQPEHLANLELTLLYDTGIVGLLVFLAFAGTIAYAAWRRRDDPFVAGLGMSALVIFLTNIATETTELMITWLLLGLLLMAVDVAAPATEQAVPRPARAA